MMMIALLHPDTPHTGMHELMSGMFWGGMIMAATPVILGVVVAWYLLQQRLRELQQDERADVPAA
jgi:hypothetical protein